MPTTRSQRLLAALLGAGLLLSACRDPEVVGPDGTEAEATGSDVAELPSPGPLADAPDPRQEALVDHATALLATLVDANSAFEVLARAASLDEARTESTRLLAVLSADPRFNDPDGDGVPAEIGVRPLLPGPTTSREETVDYGDVFTGLLSAGRDAGPAGSPFVDVLRDPIVGDLGSWQRDPQGMLDGVVAAVAGVTDVPSAETAIGELQGEAPRALAWAILANAADDLERVRAYGERGAVHLDLMLTAVRPLVDELT